MAKFFHIWSSWPEHDAEPQFLPGLEQVDDGVGERERLGPPLDEEPRQVEQ